MPRAWSKHLVLAVIDNLQSQLSLIVIDVVGVDAVLGWIVSCVDGGVTRGGVGAGIVIANPLKKQATVDCSF